MAVDINTTANGVYKHNYPSTDLHSFGLEKLTLKRLENLNVDAILMSPPCQPFTRVGKKRDCDDVRTKSFLHILQLLRKLKRKPNYLLLENVKGFEVSQTHAQLVSCLEDCGYHFQQFLLTPLQFGIPNCRLRYYLIARLDEPFSFPMEKEIMMTLPEVGGQAEISPKPSNLLQPNVCRTSHEGEACSEPNTGTSLSTSKASESHSSTRDVCQERLISGGVCDKEKTDFERQKDSGSPAPRVDVTSVEIKPDVHNSGSKKHDELTNTLDETMRTMGSCDNNSSNTFTSECHEGNKSPLLSPQKDDVSNSMNALKDAGRNMRYCEEQEPFINSSSRPLSDFMEAGTEEELREYLLPDRELHLFVVMDVVFPALKKSTCFTKRYGHYIEGAGSVVQMTSVVQDVVAASEFKTKAVEMKNRSQWGPQELQILRNLKLRYFTPREVANLLCFPPEFDFPAGLSSLQQYRVLGNSLNVHVVAQLIRRMVHADLLLIA